MILNSLEPLSNGGFMDWIENIAELPSKIINVISMILNTFSEVASALKDFYNTLLELKNTVFDMVLDPTCGSGLPVVESIGLVRYLVGDVIFHIIYIIILIGCLSTLYKLVCLLMEGWHAIKEQVSAGSYSCNAIASLLSKFIK